MRTAPLLLVAAAVAASVNSKETQNIKTGLANSTAFDLLDQRREESESEPRNQTKTDRKEDSEIDVLPRAEALRSGPSHPLLVLGPPPAALHQEPLACYRCSGQRNRCRIVSGIFTRTPLPYGYSSVTTVPDGVCNLSIVELKASKNFFALRDSDGTYLLNGNWNIQGEGKYFIAGTHFYYSPASDGRGEMLTAIGPLKESVELMILYQSPNPGIKYEYRVPLHEFSSLPSVRHRSLVHRPSEKTNFKPDSRLPHVVTSVQSPFKFPHKVSYPQVSHSSLPASIHQPKSKDGLLGSIPFVRQNNPRRQPQDPGFLGQTLTSGSPFNPARIPLEPTSHMSKESPDFSKTDKSTTGRHPNSFHHSFPADGLQNQPDFPPFPEKVKPYKNTHRFSNINEVWDTSPQEGVKNVSLQSGKGTTSLHSAMQDSRTYEDVAPNYPRERGITTGINQPLTPTKSKRKKSRRLGNHDKQRRRRRRRKKDRFRWLVIGYNECSRSCGGGNKTAVVSCQNRRKNRTVDDEYCTRLPLPIKNVVPCNIQPCSAKLVPGKWSACSASCGVGTQIRNVTCMREASNGTAIPVAEKECKDPVFHPRLQICKMPPCTEASSPTWQVGSWTPCSSGCGLGIKTRVIRCLSAGLEVDESACSEDRPVARATCDAGACINSTWFHTEWTSGCSGPCDGGFQRRLVLCSSENSCDLKTKPESTRPCLREHCPPHWLTGEWGVCSALCGVGKQYRTVLCSTHDGGAWRIVEDDQCPKDSRPVQSRKCEARKCASEWMTSPWTQCSSSCSGTQARRVECFGDGDGDGLSPVANGCDEAKMPKSSRSCSDASCALLHLTSDDTRQEGAPSAAAYERKHLPDTQLDVEAVSTLSNFLDEAADSSSDEQDDESAEGAPVGGDWEAAATGHPGFIGRPSKSGCADHIKNCNLVFRARLCRLKYYSRLCCETCKQQRTRT